MNSEKFFSTNSTKPQSGGIGIISRGKDKILYLRLKKKDKQAFIKAYDSYSSHIYRFIYFKVSDVEIAQDLTSSVFLKIWDYIQNNSLKDYKTLKSLLYVTARNLVIDHYRQTSRRPDVGRHKIELANLADEKQDLARQADLAMNFKMVQNGLSELKDEYREVIILRYVNELSVAEIADVLGKSKGNVRVMAYRALNALREIIKQE